MSSSANARVDASYAALRVLVVDDHVDSADIVATALESRGYEARVAYAPLSALAIAAEFRPQVALLDINLPTMDGYELGAALRVELPECPFPALTADVTGLNCVRSQWAGFHAHLTKPVGLDELYSAVSEARPSGTFTRDGKVDVLLRQPTTRPPRERSSIDLFGSPETVRYWTTALGCTEEELHAAVHAVGVDSEQVRAHLENARTIT